MRSFPRPTSGFALVIVLGIVVLLVVLIAGFLFRATTERSASVGYGASVSARQIADKAVSVVQAQINEAVTRGYDVAWVSQPGMVRTFDTSGKLILAYKLYSAPDMVSDTVSPSGDLPPSDWASNAGIWVDLNSPLETGGTSNFPIADPSALDDRDGVQGLSADKGKGFSVTGAPGATDSQPLPMPVRWLYLLQDGTMVAPGGSGNSATVAGATEENPIVGRVAFWTDDDTSKVNINTAAEGSFWDTPRGYAAREVRDLANKQPAVGEYCRFPGHPATTSLSAVFPLLPALSPLAYPASTSAREARAAELAARLERYLKLTPAYAFGGSEGGTIPIDISGALSPLLKAVDAKKERLYSSVDELAFTANRTANDIVTCQLLESRRFFLTAHSRAPEVNLFNLPRVACWPIYKLNGSNFVETRTTAFDRTIGFCSSTGKPGTASGPYAFEPYFFQREKNLDPKNDYDNIPRNKELYSYLQKLTGSPVPGFGGNFKTKYGDDRDEILTQMVDFIRCTNLYDDRLGENMQFTTDYNYKEGNISSGKVRRGGASVAPLQIGDTMGQGRYLGLGQFGIVFLACADGGNATSNNATTNPLLDGTPLTAGQKRVQAMIFPTLFSTMIGWPMMSIYTRIEIDGLDSLTLDGQSLHFPSSGWFEQAVSPHSVSGWDSWGGNRGGMMVPHAVFQDLRAYMPASFSTPLPSGEGLYPFVSAPATVNSSGMTLGGGSNITVRLYVGLDDPPDHAPELIQTLKLDLSAYSSASLPVPELNNLSGKKRWTFYSNDSTTMPGLQGRLMVSRTGAGGGTSDALQHLITPDYDVARALVPYLGDFRLTQAMSSMDDASASASSRSFRPHPFWSTSARKWAILSAGSTTLPSGQVQRIVSGSAIDNPLILPTSSSAAKVADTSGDFDNGTADVYWFGVAGANKPDEGQVKKYSSSGIPYYDTLNTTYGGDNSTFFSPNRMISSPVAFGSLPTGVKAGIPWRTLLFRPAAAHENTHTTMNASYPKTKDHLLLDLFWMPIVEPYVISDRFSTAGKINMNYQILPFTYIERTAPIRAVLKNEMMAAIPTAVPNMTSSSTSYDFRRELDLEEILSQFKNRFDQADKKTNVFISATEICDLHMVPQGETLAIMAGTFWTNNRMTGDNFRERIYSTVYPRLTTKSNTYTVHFRAQALKKVPGTDPDKWVEGRDVVRGEYRGSTTIERFINPDAEIPDYASQIGSLPTLQTLDTFYKWRVVNNSQFAP